MPVLPSCTNPWRRLALNAVAGALAVAIFSGAAASLSVIGQLTMPATSLPAAASPTR